MAANPPAIAPSDRMSRPPSTALPFTAGTLRCVELAASDVPALQRFFEENPAYFESVTGRGPAADEAQQEFSDLPPSGMPFRRKWMLGFVDERSGLRAMANVLEDFLAPTVWHIGLFIVASSLHGRGVASIAYERLEAWIAANGARWVRLGVVAGNARAERFWQRAGYRETRRRGDVVMGERVNNVVVMVKGLAANAPVSEYLAIVARDRPESP